MALGHCFKISKLCLRKNPFEGLQQVRIRQFRKGRNLEQPKKEFNSLETPFETFNYGGNNLNVSQLGKPLVFTIAFSGGCFVGATIWEYETMREHAISMLKKPISLFKKHKEGSLRSLPAMKWIRDKWNTLSPGEKLFVPICALNTLVFCAWRVPRLHPFMMKYFCSNPGSKSVCLPMLLSTFSHYSGFHLLANMYVLHSFSTGAVHSLGREQFLALYLSGGVISSFTSYLYKAITKQPGLSLGASGAIMTILGFVCTQYPDTQLGIIFLPMLTFSAGAAIKAIVGLDTAGVLMGWKFFDHAAHLGGAATGIFWALWGQQHLWGRREPLLQYWHDFRGSIK